MPDFITAVHLTASLFTSGSKRMAAIWIIVTVLVAIRLGYFKRFVERLKGLQWRVYFLRFSIGIPFIAACLLFFDGAIIEWVRNTDSAVIIGMVRIGEFLGRNSQFWITLCSIFLAAAYLRKQAFASVVLGGIAGAGLTALICYLFKYLFTRARPYSNLGNLSFLNFAGFLEDKHAFQSLPSGDVALVAGAASYFMVATQNKLIQALCVVSMISMALQRMYANRHWPSDTLASIWVGVIVALAVRDYCKPPQLSQK